MAIRRVVYLTHRERQIGEKIVLGFTHKEIADMLHIKEKTVGNHVGRIRDRMGIHGLETRRQFHDALRRSLAFCRISNPEE